MTIHDVLQQQLEQIGGQIHAYQADINNLLPLLQNLQQQEAAIIQWLANNPA
jgi:conjugal transfer/entry exclusion protein